MTADRIKELFPAALEDELSGDQQKLFDQALAEDPALAAEYKAYSRLVSELAVVRKLEVPADFADRVMAKVRQIPVEQPGLLKRIAALFSGGGRSRRMPFELAAAAASIALVVVALNLYEGPKKPQSETVKIVKFQPTTGGIAEPTGYSEIPRSEHDSMKLEKQADERSVVVASPPVRQKAPSDYHTISYGTVDEEFIQPDEPTLKRANTFFVLGRQAALRAAARRSSAAMPAGDSEAAETVAYEPSAGMSLEREEARDEDDSLEGEMLALRAERYGNAAESGSSAIGAGAGYAPARNVAPAAPAAMPAPAPAPPAVMADEPAAEPAPQPVVVPVTMPVTEIFIKGTDSELIAGNEKLQQAIRFIRENPSLRVGIGVYIARRLPDNGLLLVPSIVHTGRVKELFAENNIAPEQAHFSGLNSTGDQSGEPIGTIIIFKKF